jgi:hypothetical protein
LDTNDGDQPIPSSVFRDALSQFASGVTVVTVITAPGA